MKIKKVIFKNFKSYVVETVFDFEKDEHINIIFGNNGNGKTSFIEGVTLAFFGSKMFGSNYLTKEYIDFVVSRLSNNSKGDTITLTVEFFDNNINYTLTRLYKVEKMQIVKDELTILSEGDIVESCPFIEKYPYEAVEQFFLNGETIIDIIKKDLIVNYINNFIDSAFNLNSFMQVKKDLETLKRNDFKSLQSIDHRHIEKEATSLKNEVEILRGKYKSCKEEINIVSQRLTLQEAEISKRDLYLKSDNKKVFQKKEQLLNEKNKLDEELKTILQKDIQYLMHKKILDKKVEKLNSSREKRLKEINDVYRRLSEGVLPNIDYEISLESEMNLLKAFKYSNEINIQNIKNLLKNLESKNTKYKGILSKIKKTTEGQTALNILDYQNENEQLLTKLKANEISLQSRLSEKESEYLEICKQLDDYEKELLKNKIDKKSLEEQVKLEKVLTKYVIKKRNEIRRLVGKKSVESLNNYLLRKDDLVNEIRIADNYFKVLNNGTEVDYQNFSAGEKQMLIVSVIFSIIELSNSKLPIILDSFVGRLDIVHTNNILNYLVSNEELQYIILSTDSEITEERFDFLKHKVGHAYKLHNNGYYTEVSEVNYENKN